MPSGCALLATKTLVTEFLAVSLKYLQTSIQSPRWLWYWFYLPGQPHAPQLARLPPGEFIPVYYESEMGRIALEIGAFRFFLLVRIEAIAFRLAWANLPKT